MIRSVLAVAGATAFGLTLGCGGAELDPPRADEQALTGTNGDGLNGDGLNGDGLNGDGLNGTGLGHHLVSVSYASATRNGVTLDATWLEGSELVGQHGGATFRGSDFASVTFTGVSDTGASVFLRITGVSRGTDLDDDVWFYDVSYRDQVHNSWLPLCQDANGSPLPALALDGWWSYAQGVAGGGAKTEDGKAFTFACRGVGAIGKCVVPFGYKPWATVKGVSVDRYHQACVRMVRADFCGDGTPHTQDGNWIDLYDGLGIQQDTESWSFEAEWDPDGARCFSQVNRSTTPVSCDDNRAQSSSCGDPADFGAGALLMDEIPPR